MSTVSDLQPQRILHIVVLGAVEDLERHIRVEPRRHIGRFKREGYAVGVADTLDVVYHLVLFNVEGLIQRIGHPDQLKGQHPGAGRHPHLGDLVGKAHQLGLLFLHHLAFDKGTDADDPLQQPLRGQVVQRLSDRDPGYPVRLHQLCLSGDHIPRFVMPYGDAFAEILLDDLILRHTFLFHVLPPSSSYDTII